MAAPIILANVSVPLLGAVNTAVVGHLDAPYYIGAVAIGATLFNFIYHLFNCLRMGTTGPTAQARGAGDVAEVRAMIGRALLLALGASAVLLVLHRPLLDAAMWMIEASAPVEQHAREYFVIRVWALPAVLGSYAIVGWLYGLRDARTPVALLVVTNGANIVLSVMFVHGFGWGVPGVAAASLIAEYAGFAAGLLCVVRALRRLPRAAQRGPADRPGAAAAPAVHQRRPGAAHLLRGVGDGAVHGAERRPWRRAAGGEPGTAYLPDVYVLWTRWAGPCR
jgi:MATE family multidrug resistance protein